MNTLETAARDLLLALYRAWYELPYKATRVPLDAARAALAQALATEPGTEPPAEPVAALKRFAAALPRLPEVREAAGNSLRALDAALAEPGAALAPEARRRLAGLASAPDPFAAALGTMLWQPPALFSALYTLRGLSQDAELPAADRVRAAAALEQFDAALDDVRFSYDGTLGALQEVLSALEKIPTLRRLAWRTLLDAKVASPAQLIQTLGAMAGRPLESAPHEETAAANGGQDEGGAARTSVTLHSEVQFPRAVKRNAWEPLIVRFVTAPPDESAAAAAVAVPFVDPSRPELVDVLLTAPGFDERLALWQRTVLVYSDRASQPAIFLLRSSLPGPKRLTLDLYHAGRHIGSAAFESTVAEATAALPATPIGEPLLLDALLGQPAPPSDLELRVVRGSESNRLFFTLHSTRADVGFHWLPVGDVTLTAQDPFAFLEHQFERLSDLAARDENATPAALAEATAAVTAIGEALWDQVVPDLFKAGCWPEIKRLRARGVVRSLVITSDEPWIPWEIVKPYTRDEVTEGEESEPFWAEQFEMARWLAGRAASERTAVLAARLVAPDLDLAYVEQEKQAFDALGARGVRVAPPLRTRTELRALLAEGGAQLIHVSAHGSFDAAAPGRAHLTLQDGPFTADELSPSATAGLRKARPLVFLNACSVGRLGLSLTGLGGWAERLIQTGRVGAFVGTLWEVNDRLAAAFAVEFYRRLFDGATLGQALQAARLHVRTLDPANPTWLAYTLYGDPNARVSAG